MFKISQASLNTTDDDMPSIPHNRSERFAEFSDEDSAAFLAVNENTKQVDFYKNPTILSRLILNHNYASSIKRVRTHPEEVSVWVAMKRNPFKREQYIRRYLQKDKSDRSFAGSVRSIDTRQKSFYHVTKRQKEIMVDYSMRQLPIHMACSNLIRPTKPEEQEQLEKLIALLIISFPEGCDLRDHDGKLPLHEAIWHNASVQTVSMMLMASPHSLHQRDKFGRSPVDLNRIRSGGDKEKVKDLLVRGVNFWEQAQTKVDGRRMDAEDDSEHGGTGACSQRSLRPDPKGDLNPLVRDISRQIKHTGNSLNASVSSQQTSDQGDDASVVEPISWVRLEQRAFYLEQLLAGMYEKNYELGENLEELTRERLALQEQVETLKSRVGCTNESIFEENDRLRDEIATMRRMEEERSQRDVSLPRAGSGPNFDLTDDDHRGDEQIQYLREHNASLQEEVDLLSEKIQEYESQINRLEIIAGLVKRPARKEETDAETLASIPENEEASGKDARRQNEDTAQDDLDSLLESLSTNSRFATERFLAGKVRLLEERLNEEMVAREADVRANNQENARLMMENEALHSECNRLSQSMLKSGRRMKSLPVTGEKTRQKQTGVRTYTEDLAEKFNTDDLDSILSGAASMYGSSRTSLGSTSSRSIGEDSEFENLLDEAFKLYGTKKSDESLLSASSTKVANEERIHEIRNEVQRIEAVYGKPVPLEVKMSLVSAVSSLSLGTRQSEDDYEDLEAFLEEASKFYGKPIPSDLRAAMQGTKLVALSGKSLAPSRQPDEDDDLGKVFEEAGRLYQKPIPVGVQNAVRSVVSSSSGMRGSEGTPPTTNLSPATSSSLSLSSDEEELRAIIKDAEEEYGKPLPDDMKNALLRASMSSTRSHVSDASLSRADIDNRLHRSAMGVHEAGEMDEIEGFFDETERTYGKPIPAAVKVAVRNAVSSNVESSERRMPPQADEETLDAEEELDAIIRDAERAYGRSLPPDLKHALLTASVSSGLSLRSLGESSLQLEDSDDRRDGFLPRESQMQLKDLEEDDLDEMFEKASRLYRQPIPSDLKDVVRDSVASGSRLNLDGSSEDEIYEELENIISDAERAYGKPLSPRLKHALLTTSIASRMSLLSALESQEQATDDDGLAKMFEEASILSRQPIPPRVKIAYRDAMSSRSMPRISAPQATSSRMNRKGSVSTFEELDSIIHDAEEMYGKSLSPELKHALLTASISSRLLLQPSRQPVENRAMSEIPEDDLSEEEDEDLREMFHEASILYKRPIPARVKEVVKDAVSTSSRRMMSSSVATPTEDTSPGEDELEAIILDAEDLYGQPLPEDLKQALLTASISSGLGTSSRFDIVSRLRSQGGSEMATNSQGPTDDHPFSDDLNEMFIVAAKQNTMSPGTGRSEPYEAQGTSGRQISALTMSADLQPLPDDNSMAAFASDNLDDIFAVAGKKYGLGESSIRMDSQATPLDDGSKSMRTIESAQSAQSSEEPPSYLPKKLSTRVDGTKKISVSAIDDGDDDRTLNSIIQEAEAAYGKPMDDGLKRALQAASVRSGLSFGTADLSSSSRLGSIRDDEDAEQSDAEDDDLDKMIERAQYKVFRKAPASTTVNSHNVYKIFEEAAKIYDKPIPPEILSAIRDAVSHDDSESEYSGSESDSEDDLESSDSSVASSVDDELASLIREAEIASGSSLSTETKKALLGGREESMTSSDLLENYDFSLSAPSSYGDQSRSELFMEAARSYARSNKSDQGSNFTSDNLDEIYAARAGS